MSVNGFLFDLTPFAYEIERFSKIAQWNENLLSRIFHLHHLPMIPRTSKGETRGSWQILLFRVQKIILGEKIKSTTSFE